MLVRRYSKCSLGLASVTVGADATLESLLVAVGKSILPTVCNLSVINTGSADIKIDNVTTTAASYVLKANNGITFRTCPADAKTIHVASAGSTLSVQQEGEG